MDSRHYKDLQEAYHQVYDDLHELNMKPKEGPLSKVAHGVADATVNTAKWIRDAPMRHRLAVADYQEKKRQKKIPYAAMTLEDAENIILTYLLDEGYVDSIEAAQGMMEAMSEDWLSEILDEGIMSGLKSVGKGIKGALKPRPLPRSSQHDVSVTADPELARQQALYKATGKVR